MKNLHLSLLCWLNRRNMWRLLVHSIGNKRLVSSQGKKNYSRNTHISVYFSLITCLCYSSHFCLYWLASNCGGCGHNSIHLRVFICISAFFLTWPAETTPTSPFTCVKTLQFTGRSFKIYYISASFFTSFLNASRPKAHMPLRSQSSQEIMECCLVTQWHQQQKNKWVKTAISTPTDADN